VRAARLDLLARRRPLIHRGATAPVRCDARAGAPRTNSVIALARASLHGGAEVVAMTEAAKKLRLVQGVLGEEDTQRVAIQAAGWRTGRPVEDPEKTKRWGLVTAKPSEYLVHCRRGRILGTSGQGASCFKWPWDSVAIVPTSLQRLSFTADQVTREKVGVAVTGLAVYRIAEPRIAFRVLNFSYVERAQEKLEQTLTSMLVGATRRLVANLAVEEVIQKRKDALGTELLREIAPVVGGAGRVEDGTDRGWGVVIDTIEIQDVRVLSERVFESMQAPFRAALERGAREARAEASRRSELSEADAQHDVRRGRAEADKRSRLAELDAEREVKTARADMEKRGRLAGVDAEREVKSVHAEAEKQQALADAEAERVVREARIAAEAAVAASRTAAEREATEAWSRGVVRRSELAGDQAAAEVAAHGMRLRALAAAVERQRTEWEAALVRRRSESEAGHQAALREAEVARLGALVRRIEAEARARELTAEKLPELAAAVGDRMGEVKVTHVGVGEGAFATIADAVRSVLALAAIAERTPGSGEEAT
jgi:regulator of protease activity HflC (stomatin/prohibitin superfamily)